MISLIFKQLAEIDQWLDDFTGPEYHDQPLAQDWARISKIQEELGEATEAFIAYTAQNPRKDQTASIHDTLTELCDVACTALLAIQHFTKDEMVTGQILVTGVRTITARMVESKRVRHIQVSAEYGHCAKMCSLDHQHYR